jgi:uncharacterized membrane protein
VSFGCGVCRGFFQEQGDSYEYTFDSFDDSGGGRTHHLIGSFAGLAAGAALITLAGCSGSVSGTINCKTGGSCTGGIKGTVSWVQLVPLTETSNMHTSFATQNVNMDDGSYTGTLAAYNTNHDLIASRSVNFYVAGNVAYLSNPSVVQQRVNTHSQNGSTIEMNNFTIPYHVTNPNAETARVTATTYVDNQPVTSATSSFRVDPSRRPCKPCAPIKQRSKGSGH